jgi:hypothetical protein
MSKTRHLDTAISILSGEGVAKRKRGPVIEVTVHADSKRDTFMVQVGSRITEEGTGDSAAARAAGEAKAEALRQLGKKTKLIVY